MEKLKEERVQVENQTQLEIAQLKDKQQLQLKNELLEQKLNFKEEVAQLKEEIANAKQVHSELEREYNQKLQDMYKDK